MLCLWPNRLDNTFCYYRVINILPPFQMIRRFDFFGTSILLDVPKKSKRLIIWNEWSIFLCIIALWLSYHLSNSWTGSGKTYTMQPLPLRAAQDMVRLLHQPVYRNQNFKLWLSYFEIYGGKLFDLLSDRRLVFGFSCIFQVTWPT